MTDALDQSDLGARLQMMLRRSGRFLGRAAFGVLLIVAAFAALLATTVIGFILALAAVFLTLGQRFGRRDRMKGATGGHTVSNDGTLDARQTADGWVIETRGFSGR